MSQLVFIAVMRHHDQGNSKEEFIGGLHRVSEVGPWEAGRAHTHTHTHTHTLGGGRKDRRQDGDTGRTGGEERELTENSIGF